MRLASPWRLLCGSLMDGVLICIFVVWIGYPALAAVWEAVSGAPVVTPTVGFMSNYSRPAQNGYWTLVLASVGAALLLLPTFAAMLGTTPGKYCVGVVFRMADGSRVPFLRLLGKTLVNVGLFLLAALPGPIAGFVFGSVADSMSLLFLAMAVGVAIRAMRGTPEHPPIAYRFAGFLPVRWNNV